MSKSIIPALLLLFCVTANGQSPRARDIGIPFEGTPGKFNAITDVAGVEVGYSTIISGQGKNVRGAGPVRTGVTAILPRGRNNNPVYANWYSLNGNGEMTGTTWITESGFLETPIMITNTNSVGVVRDAVLKWFVNTGWYKEDFWYTYPVVAETYDGFLNDIYGFHVKESHAYEALNSAKSGLLQEGNVGGGTGMMCLGFKGGTGTASRVVRIRDSSYTLGVLVQSNFGAKHNLTIAGVPVGRELRDTLNYEFKAPPSYQPGDGSIIVVVATNAPILPHQLKRIVARVPISIGKVGGRGENGSGDIFIAFSTANPTAFNRRQFSKVDQLPNDLINPLFEATVQAVEEAIVNAMVAAETMEGINGNKAHRLPHKLVVDVLKKYGRVAPVQGPQPKKIMVGGVALHYIERGQGEPLTLLHGGQGDYRAWGPQMDAFASRYRVISYSRRYHYPNENQLTSKNHSALVDAADLAAFIDALKLGPVHLVGTSYGAFTALAFALDNPQLVRSMALNEPPVLQWAAKTEKGAPLYRDFMNNIHNPAGKAFVSGDDEGAMRIFIDRFDGTGAFNALPAERKKTVMQNAGFFKAVTASSNPFPDLPRDKVKQLNMPVLLIRGANSKELDIIVSDELARVIPHVKRAIIPQAGHVSPRQNPAAFNTAVLEFLSALK